MQPLRGEKHDDLFTGGSAVDLFLATSVVVSAMVREARTDDDDMRKAAENLRTLLAEMESARVSLGLSHFQERTVSKALSSLCPGFWPFC